MELELVFNGVIKSSITASIMAVLILLINYALRNKLDAKWQYAIWMLLILRLLIPYDIQSSWSIYSLVPNSVPIPIVNHANIRMTDIVKQISNISGKEVLLSKDQTSINKQSNPKAEEPISKDLSYGKILAIIWLVGALVLTMLTIAANLKFYFRVRRELAVPDARISELLQECTHKLGIRKNLPIVITNRPEAPCLYGFFSPRLLLSKSLVNRLTEENIRHIFIHELVHYKRKDILINWLAVAAQIAHWFNPLIWYSLAKMREDCELACDAVTLSYLKPEEYQSYGFSIISLVPFAQSPRFPGTTDFLGNKNKHQIRRRIKKIKSFHKHTWKWTGASVVIFISLGLVGCTSSISNTALAAGVTPLKQPVQSDHLSSVTAGGFDYNKSLLFTPLLPSYTAGYQLIDSSAYKETTPPNKNVSRYLANYGNSEEFKFMVHETTSPEGMHPLYFAGIDQGTKTQIKIGDVPATLYESENGNAIQFIKNGIEYTTGTRHDGGISLDDLKKICASIVVSVKSPPANFYINKTGPTAFEGLSFKTLQPGDIVIPQGLEFQVASSQQYSERNKKSEIFELYYTADAFLNIKIGKGDHPFGEPTPMLTPDSDLDTKQIEGTKVILRRKNNDPSLPAAKFTIPGNELECMIYTTVQESDIEKTVESILRAYSKL